MITRRRIRVWACFGGVALGAVAAAAFIVTCFKGFMLDNGPFRSVFLARGSLAVNWQRRSTSIQANGMPTDVGNPGGTLWRWLPKWSEPTWASNGRFVEYSPGEFILPLWIPAAFGLWCLYRLVPERPPPHLCECGYDLRAIPAREGSRTCPECGRITLPGH